MIAILCFVMICIMGSIIFVLCKKGKKSKKVVLVILLAVFGGDVACKVAYYIPKKYEVTITDKETKIYKDKDDSLYLVYGELQNGEYHTFCIKDDVLLWRWNSSDVYASMKKGQTYEVEAVGWRIPFFSSYENIKRVTPLNEKSDN